MGHGTFVPGDEPGRRNVAVGPQDAADTSVAERDQVRRRSFGRDGFVGPDVRDVERRVGSVHQHERDVVRHELLVGGEVTVDLGVPTSDEDQAVDPGRNELLDITLFLGEVVVSDADGRNQPVSGQPFHHSMSQLGKDRIDEFAGDDADGATRTWSSRIARTGEFVESKVGQSCSDACLGGACNAGAPIEDAAHGRLAHAGELGNDFEWWTDH